MEYAYQQQIINALKQTISLLGTHGMQNCDENADSKFPAFYSCFDWHSSVHSHWQIARAIEYFKDLDFLQDGIEVLRRNITKENIEREVESIKALNDIFIFEMPYGLAWALVLCAELYNNKNEALKALYSHLLPLQEYSLSRFIEFCEKDEIPIRNGLHTQTAFSLGLVLDSARILNESRLVDLVEKYVRKHFIKNIVHVEEPEYNDFLSPSLSEADLVRRILSKEDFIHWITEDYMPQGFNTLSPAKIDNTTLQCHLIGLNFSRSWMLNKIIDSMPEKNSWISNMRKLSDEHFQEGMVLCDNSDFMVSHWIPTFLIYHITKK